MSLTVCKHLCAYMRNYPLYFTRNTMEITMRGDDTLWKLVIAGVGISLATIFAYALIISEMVP